MFVVYPSSISENFSVTKSNLAELKEILKERAEECSALQKQINLQVKYINILLKLLIS